MKEAIEYFKSFKSLLVEDYPLIKPYFDSYASKRKYPRFLTYFNFIKRTKESTFYYAIRESCLIIIRKKWIFKPTFVLYLPPINLEGKKYDELALMKKLMRMGIPFKFSEEDIKFYNLKRREYKINVIQNEKEYIYDNTFKHFDRMKKRNRYSVKRDLKGEYLNYKYVTKLNDELLEEMHELHRSFMKKKNLNRVGGVIFHEHLIDIRDDMYFTMLFEPDGTMSAYTATEKVAKGKYLKVNVVLNYDVDTVYYDRTKLMHYLEVDYIKESEFFLSSGRGVDKKLQATKEILQPVYMYKIYRVALRSVEPAEFTKEEYNQMCIGKEGYIEPPEMMLQ